MDKKLLMVINEQKSAIKVPMILKEESQRFTKLLFKAFFDSILTLAAYFLGGP